MSRAFFDVRVLNPIARTNWQRGLQDACRCHENQKKKEYNARIVEIEKGSFTPLVFSCSGGVAPEAATFVKKLALKLSNKRLESYSSTVNFIRRRLRFDLLRTCLISLRGERSNNSQGRCI